MTTRSDRALRRAAATFAVAALPLAVAVMLAGGGFALAPLALLLTIVLVTGRAPGVERLGALRSRPPVRRRHGDRAMPQPDRPRRVAGGGLLIAASLSKRGPPLSA